jgi:DNA replication protein DnaC
MENPLFMGASDLLDHLRATFNPESKITYDARFANIRNTPLLILNYLDTTNATPWAKEKLYQILNYRYMVPLPTVITTVLPVQEIDPNIRSRLLDYQVCQIIQMFQVPMYSKNPNIDILPERSKRTNSYHRAKS